MLVVDSFATKMEAAGANGVCREEEDAYEYVSPCQESVLRGMQPTQPGTMAIAADRDR
jgi:hypothetical protein